ncbi:hypothetical protein [Streptomyces griseocarneus]|uniref:hypothetical protein n=1 Tax=Streptomyces griseocarneus TaxID=51201 RepID=UPI00167DA801|nr:hypothetical protein [Streptomyces griseocarneus]MBZ6477890.1 hypothetical protein [Streptomyces griseocarneus]
MRAELRDVASELAGVLWQRHTIYRDRAGQVVIRGEHVQRWISLASTGGSDEALLRAGRILDGGTTAPARAEAVVSLSAGTAALAAVCRRLLAETTDDATAPATRTPRAPRGRRRARSGSRRDGHSGPHTGLTSWIVIVCTAGFLGLCLYSAWANGS